MPQITRTKCFVGTSVNPSEEELAQAAVLAHVLYRKHFLPVMPHVYQQLLGAEGEDYLHLRLFLLGECDSAVWVGNPTELEVKACVELGIASRSLSN